MPRRVVLTGSATFAADGTATAVSRSIPLGEVWRVTYTNVKTTSTAETEVTTYRGPAVPSNRVDYSRRRGNGASSDTAFELRAGEYLTVVWEGGTPGAAADFSAAGEV